MEEHRTSAEVSLLCCVQLVHEYQLVTHICGYVKIVEPSLLCLVRDCAVRYSWGCCHTDYRDAGSYRVEMQCKIKTSTTSVLQQHRCR